MIDLEALYAILADVAKRQRQITYGDLSQAYLDRTDDWHEPHGTWDVPLGDINRGVHELQLPPLSAVVVLDATKEPGGLFWGCSPNVPSRPKNDLKRIALYGQILQQVFQTNWPESVPFDAI